MTEEEKEEAEERKEEIVQKDQIRLKKAREVRIMEEITKKEQKTKERNCEDVKEVAEGKVVTRDDSDCNMRSVPSMVDLRKELIRRMLAEKKEFQNRQTMNRTLEKNSKDAALQTPPTSVPTQTRTGRTEWT